MPHGVLCPELTRASYNFHAQARSCRHTWSTQLSAFKRWCRVILATSSHGDRVCQTLQTIYIKRLSDDRCRSVSWCQEISWMDHWGQQFPLVSHVPRCGSQRHRSASGVRISQAHVTINGRCPDPSVSSPVIGRHHWCLPPRRHRTRPTPRRQLRAYKKNRFMSMLSCLL